MSVGAPGGWRGRRIVLVALAVASIVVAALVVVRSLVLRDRARAVPTDEVVDRFRTSFPSTASTSLMISSTTVVATTTTTPTAPPTGSTNATAAPDVEIVPPQLVEPGVYSYRTAGFERIDALGGARHDYPATTTITVLPAACGVTLRWDALRERWDEWQLCADTDGIAVQPEAVQFHEFFGQPEHEPVVCDVSVVVVPSASRERDPVPQACTLGGDPWSPTWEVLERTTLRVDGAAVDVQHVRMRVDDADEHWEDQVVDWYLARSGLPIQVTVTKSSSSPSPIGAVVYEESYRLELESFAPLR